MSELDQPDPNPQDSLKLKLAEPDVASTDPWNDDVLDRAQIATRLTDLMRNQSMPLVVSIHGYWGTGKTFLLKRWHQDLENQGFRAIYFNAWEDDFCDNPLLAILGQLSAYLKDSGFKAIAERVARIALPLIRNNLLGVLSKTTGLTLDIEQRDQDEKSLLDDYLGQRAAKDELKRQLTALSAKVTEDTGKPMVFIIDELDRCRPTFAIELLERVKHIFDVPNMVFVFGINRDELCVSLQSIYGDIDANIYLRRFFDMEFTLPEVDTQSFARHLMQKYELGTFFRILSKSASNQRLTAQFDVLAEDFPALWGRLGLSLRDIDYCVRLIALVGKALTPRSHMFPWLVGLLIALRIKNSSLYRRFMQGNCHASEVMDYIDEIPRLQGLDARSVHMFLAVEAYLYKAEFGDADFSSPTSSPWDQLRLLKNGEPLTQPEYLSKNTREAGSGRAGRLVEIVNSERTMTRPGEIIRYVAHLIDLHEGFVGR